MTITLPTAKTTPEDSAKQAKILLYGQPKIGKSTLAATFNAEKTLVMACEPGMGGIEAFVQPVGSWEEFRETGAALAKGDHPFETVVVDTTDEAFRFCQDYTMKLHKIKHPSEMDFGAGWALLADEWRLRVAKLCSLGMSVIFISHAKDVKVEQRVGSITKTVPTLTGQAGKFLMGFCDFILFATFDEQGNRVMRTQPSEFYDAGQRLPQFPLPDPMELSASDLAEALGIITAPTESKTKTIKEKTA